jgi:pyruvate, water dikinase
LAAATAETENAMTDLIIPLGSAHACEPSLVGPKAATLAILRRARLPVPDGFCLTADAYRLQVAGLDLGAATPAAPGSAAAFDAARRSVAIRLGLYEGHMAAPIREGLDQAWRERSAHWGLAVVRSSALIEDRAGSNFAGQFQSFLGVGEEAEFFTAVRACWAALWSSHARRALARHGLEPGETAMAVLIQPLISARAAGGGLSRIGDDHMVLNATWGLGSAIAQGEVVPDRIVLTRQGFVRKIEPGYKEHRTACQHGSGESAAPVPAAMVETPCLTPGEAVTLGRLLRRCEDVLGMAVEIEWALDDHSFSLLQARPLTVAPAQVPDEIWSRHPGLTGHPAGVGWGSGRACVVNCECELSRVSPGDILVTRVAGPALGAMLAHVAGVVAERGGSTSHLASLARERGIPMVLGVRDATRRIPDGAQVAVDAVAGLVRWTSG